MLRMTALLVIACWICAAGPVLAQYQNSPPPCSAVTPSPLGGAARGAAGGAIIGGIAGNAGKGAAIGAAVGGIGRAVQRGSARSSGACY
jgi:Glycine-zipper domain